MNVAISPRESVERSTIHKTFPNTAKPRSALYRDNSSTHLHDKFKYTSNTEASYEISESFDTKKSLILGKRFLLIPHEGANQPAKNTH